MRLKYKLGDRTNVAVPSESAAADELRDPSWLSARATQHPARSPAFATLASGQRLVLLGTPNTAGETPALRGNSPTPALASHSQISSFKFRFPAPETPEKGVSIKTRCYSAQPIQNRRSAHQKGVNFLRRLRTTNFHFRDRRRCRAKEPGATFKPAREYESHFFEGLLEISEQIAPMLDADRDPNEAVSDAGMANSFSVKPECVVVFGWQASVSTPPSETALRPMCRWRRKSNAAGLPPRSSRENMPPG